jgi:CDP-glycerol glycerophosphotransferase
VFPVKKRKILFCSFNGEQYSCNPKYIYEYLQEHEKAKYDCIWCFGKSAVNRDIKYYNKSRMFLHFWHNLTAKIVIINDYPSWIIPYRKNQVVIYTGHGGGSYKKVEINGKLSVWERYNRKSMENAVTYAISSSRATSRDYNSYYLIDNKKILNFGMARHDIFFSQRMDVVQKVKEFHNIALGSTSIVLYAPTYRGKTRQMPMIRLLYIKDILNALNNRFNKNFVLILRAHHASKYEVFDHEEAALLNGNLYEDMQELLYASDVLITDYSSCIFDHCLTGKPLFLYTPDVEEYSEVQGFSIPIEQWGFPLAGTVETLIKNIMKFDDERHKKAISYHLELMGSYETGKSRKLLVDFLGNL